MRSEERALSESFLLHGVLAGMIFVMAGLLTPPLKSMRLDFSILDQEAPPAPRMETTPPSAEPPPPLPPQKAAPVQEAARQMPPKPKPVKPKTALAAVEPIPATATPAPAPATNQPEPRAAVSSDEHILAAPRTEDQDIAGAAEYRRTNFAAIRDAILTKIHYPTIARRKGWQGKVDVSFVINTDGSAGDLQVLASSGHPVLDEQALDAVRRSAPFIPPGSAIHLIMPVTFQLDKR